MSVLSLVREGLRVNKNFEKSPKSFNVLKSLSIAGVHPLDFSLLKGTVKKRKGENSPLLLAI